MRSSPSLQVEGLDGLGDVVGVQSHVHPVAEIGVVVLVQI